MSIESKVFIKGDPEWQELRSRFITATEISGLFALNPYTSPAKIYANKINPTFSDNVYTRMGRILEPAVLNLASDILGVRTHLYSTNGDKVFYSEHYGLSATPDAFIADKLDKAGALLELKTTSLDNARKWSVEPPLHYLAQLALQSLLTDVHTGYLVIMHPRYPDLPSLILKTEYIQEIGELMISEAARFRQHFFGEVEASQAFRVDRKACVRMRELLVKNIETVHNSVTLERPVFNWD